jgi:autotransporter-associated beta strand protein
LRLIALHVCFCTALLVRPSLAADAIWGGASDGLWATAGNWSASPPGSGDAAIFDNAGNAQTTITTGTIGLRQLLFDTGNVAAYTLANGTITFDNSGAIVVTNTVTSSQTINAAITLGNGNVVTNNGSAILAIGGSITNGPNTLVVDGSGDTTILGILGVGSGSGGLTKQGSGTLRLTNNGNAFKGPVTIKGGVLEVTTLTGGNTACALGASVGTAGNLVFDGGTLRYTGNSVGVINRAFTLKAAGGTIDIANSAATVNWSDEYGAGPITGSGNFTKAGPGTLVFRGANTYTGGTVINAGKLQLAVGSNRLPTGTAVTLANTAGAVLDLNSLDQTIGSLTGGGANGGNVALGSGTLTVGNATSTTYGGSISGTGRVVKQGTGTLTLGGINTFSGGVTVSQGALDITEVDSFQGSNIVNNAMLILEHHNNQYTQSSKAISGTGELRIRNGGGARLSLSAANTYTGSTIIEAGVLQAYAPGGALPRTTDLTINSGASLTVADYDLAINGLNGSGAIQPLGGYRSVTLTVGANGGNGSFSGLMRDSGTVVLSLAKSGSGTQRLSGTNTFTGNVTIAEGVLEATAIADKGTACSVGAGTTITLGSATTRGTLRYLAGSDSQHNNRDIVLAAGGGVLNVARYMDLNGVISGSGDLVKTGATDSSSSTGSRVSLNTANTYTGNTYIDEGVLQIVHSGAVPATSNVTIASAGRFRLWANGVINGLNGSGKVEPWKDGSVSLTLGANGGNGTFSGSIVDNNDGGRMALVKNGTGSQILSGVNSYTGATTVNAGTLVVDGSIATSSGVELGGEATLAGNGNVSQVHGAGLISPGSSTGVLTATSIDPAAGLDFAFEFTASGSDVLRLTDLSSPFAAPLNSGNTIRVYLNVDHLEIGDVFRGGLYTDRSTEFLSQISDATWEYLVRGDGGGTHVFGEVNYYSFAEISPAVGLELSTALEPTWFGSGGPAGYVLQLSALAVPEPGANGLLLLGGLALLVWWAHKKTKGLKKSLG